MVPTLNTEGPAPPGPKLPRIPTQGPQATAPPMPLAQTLVGRHRPVQLWPNSRRREGIPWPPVSTPRPTQMRAESGGIPHEACRGDTAGWWGSAKSNRESSKPGIPRALGAQENPTAFTTIPAPHSPQPRGWRSRQAAWRPQRLQSPGSAAPSCAFSKQHALCPAGPQRSPQEPETSDPEQASALLAMPAGHVPVPRQLKIPSPQGAHLERCSDSFRYNWVLEIGELVPRW